MNKLKPTIAFFGTSLVSAYRKGAATYYRGIIKYMNRLGYRIAFYGPDAYGRLQNRDINDPHWAEIVVYENNVAALGKAVEEAKKADIIIKASGIGAFDELLERYLPEIKQSWQRIIFWDIDAPATLDSLLGNPDAQFRKLIPSYDYILTYGGGDPVVNAYKSLNAKECIPVYNAVDPETHFPVPAESRFLSDFSFLGNRLPDREERVKELFFKPASKLNEKQFMLGGKGWGDIQFPENVRYVNHVFSTDHNAFNSSSTIVLNISRQSTANYGFSPATRIFEAAGAGACIITDNRKGIENFLVPGKEILVANDGNEVSWFLSDIGKEEAAEIGKAARKRVLADHTYEKRAMLLDNILSKQEVVYNQ